MDTCLFSTVDQVPVGLVVPGVEYHTVVQLEVRRLDRKLSALKQMLSQKSGGSVVSITSSIVDHPLAALTASVAMITKGGIDAISRSLAMEYAPQNIRVNVVAPGVVDTPLHKNNPKEFLRTLSPLGQISAAKDIAEAVFYLTEASQVTGEVLHVDGGAHLGRW